MGKPSGASVHKSPAGKQYEELLKHCKVRLRDLKETLPAPLENFRDILKSKGVSRREFLKWTSIVTATLMLPAVFRPQLAEAAELFNRVPVVWLSFAECTGCAEAFLRTSYPGIDEILLETISLEYQENLMAAAGYQAEENLEKCVRDFPGKFICIIEGAVPRGLDGNYMRIGPKGRTAIEIARAVAPKAGAVICMGSCASFGNVPAAEPNPTKAVSVGNVLGMETVNLSGCPPNGLILTGTLLYYILFGALPPVDTLGRPLWAYGKRIHDTCERRSHYDAGEYVEAWGDEGAKKGWCLYKMGCKGPYTYAGCARIRYNDHVSWPVMAGHGCIGCYEPAFWDTMAPLEKPIAEVNIWDSRTVDTVGIVLAGAAAAGIAAHAVLSGVKHGAGGRPSPDEEANDKPGEDRHE